MLNSVKNNGELAKWHEKVDQSGFKSFGTISRTITNHYQTILNYFDNRSTNASAEMKFMNTY
ncbi:transposase [Flavobacterium ovatum]|uniref:transposase n=1 Tax=Flavobacterium ovatum TaxID=1928857 RepID=UPI00344F02D3